MITTGTGGWVHTRFGFTVGDRVGFFEFHLILKFLTTCPSSSLSAWIATMNAATNSRNKIQDDLVPLIMLTML